MIQIAEVFSPQQESLARMVKQCGVEHVVAMINLRPKEGASDDEQPWSYESLARVDEEYNEAGFEMAVIESRPPMHKTKLGLDGRDEEIEVICEFIRNMGRVGIPCWCPEFMAGGVQVLRTSTDIVSRGGALVTGYDHAIMSKEPLTEYGEVSEDKMWSNLEYFLERVVPVAETADVKLAMHPDDPPLSPIRGIARIMSSVDNYQRMIDLVPSAHNGVALCQGNFGLMTNDLPAAIRRFGADDKIHFVHFRDVRGTNRKFEETFHDDGQTDMYACMKAYKDIGYEGVCRPDHVPTMEGDDNDRPMYSSIGRLFAIGYLKGLQESVYRT
ncbi:TIM barrel protein [Candidatus Poribacteria bacterium]|jgi:mannonate dehydratase|nr:TIM barrel protein [Candidatus Poribacteria bacterium]MBT5532947.1 TIM barrel protein [Candidatus Poribacteria bacterium]MBT5711443.1 TIM barrel protein [Candidatus Poribacteria bacterium]MBT7098128.1 TIM barrel protein [Candidatus Poribacteria bacterium]MBT7805775.1 TIM barrel protein [Candidatus Poribacteria bacterium]